MAFALNETIFFFAHFSIENFFNCFGTENESQSGWRKNRLYSDKILMSNVEVAGLDQLRQPVSNRAMMDDRVDGDTGEAYWQTATGTRLVLIMRQTVSFSFIN